MSKWYIRQDGGCFGPLATNELRERISRREILPIDFVYSETSESWRLVAECDEFRTAVNVHETAPAEWTILEMRGKKRLLRGPYARQTVLDLLASGRIQYSDYAWRTEAPEWKRIGDVDDLDRRAPHKIVFDAPLEPSEIEISIPDIPAECLVAKIYRADTLKPLPSKDERPSDAAGEDLADTTKDLRAQIVNKFKLFGVALFISAVFGVRPAKAESVDIVAIRAASSEPALLIQTDAPIGSRIEVQLDQALGDVPDLMMFSKSFTLTREAGELPTVLLEDLDLKPGTYRVTAVVNRTTAHRSFFRGVRDQAFEQALSAFQKDVSLYRQEERKALYDGAKSLQELAKQIQTNQTPGAWTQKWSESFRKIEVSLTTLGVKRSLAYPDWSEDLKSVAQVLRLEFEILTNSAGAKRGLASADDTSAPAPVDKDSVRTNQLKDLESRLLSLRQRIGKNHLSESTR